MKKESSRLQAEECQKAQNLDRPDSEPSPSPSEPEDDLVQGNREQGIENRE